MHRYLDSLLVRCQEGNRPSTRFQEEFRIGRFRKFTNNCGYIGEKGGLKPSV